jgi:hypothetical protein
MGGPRIEWVNTVTAQLVSDDECDIRNRCVRSGKEVVLWTGGDVDRREGGVEMRQVGGSTFWYDKNVA